MGLSLSSLSIFNSNLNDLPLRKLMINTINAHSFNIAQKDVFFAEALKKSDILLPDGISIVLAKRFLQGTKLRKIAGSDLFYYEMNRLNEKGGTCLFIGSNEATLKLIYEHALLDFPKISVFTHSPPYKEEFSIEDDQKMISLINSLKPDVLFVGMSAPKQEKWAYKHFDELVVGHICCIGAVFDFYSGNIKRASKGIIKLGFEWLYRLLKEPGRLWRRYLFGNIIFIQLILREKKSFSKNF